MGRLTENSVLNIKNKSHAVTAEIDVPDGGAEGVIIAQGGAFGGWSLYVKDGQAGLLLQPASASSASTIDGEQPVPAGEHQVRMEFAYDGGGLAKGGDVTLYVDGDKVGEGRVDATVPMVFSARRDHRRRPRQRDPGQRRLRPERQRLHRARSHWVQIDIDEAAEDLDHLITPEERLRVAMARQ